MTPDHTQDMIDAIKARISVSLPEFFVENTRVVVDFTSDCKLVINAQGRTWLVILQPQTS